MAVLQSVPQDLREWGTEPFVVKLIEQVKLRLIADLIENCKVELDQGDAETRDFVTVETSRIRGLKSMDELMEFLTELEIHDDDTAWLFTWAARDLMFEATARR